MYSSGAGDGLQEIGRLNHGFFSAVPADLVFTNEGGSLLLLSDSGVVSVYNIDASEEASMNRAVGMGELVSCSFDPDGTAVLAIEEDHLLCDRSGDL